jgi:hypothetical protein
MPDGENQPNQNPRPLRTFQSDVEEMLKQGNGSLTKIAVAENEKRIRTEGYTMDPTEEPLYKKTRFIVGASVTLVILGVLIMGTIYLFRGGTTAPTAQSVNPSEQPIIATDSSKNFNLNGLNRDQIIKSLLKERDQNASAFATINGIKLIEGSTETSGPVSASEFLEKIDAHAPSGLVRSLDNNFIFGLHSIDTTEPFLIFKTGYYQNAFAGMLAWEKNLREDLGPINSL